MSARVNRWFNCAAAAALFCGLGWLGWQAAARHYAAISSQAAQAAAVQAEGARQLAQRAAAVKPHVPQRLEVLEGMATQGPIVVNTGVDGGEDPTNGAWTNPANVHSSSNASVAVGQAGLSASLKTNTLKCQFSAAAFSVPAGNVISQISVTFQGVVSGGMGAPVVRVQSVKTTLTGATDQADLASLTVTDTGYTYTFTGLAVSQASINGAWEIDLRFDSDNSTDFGSANVYKVSATVTYQLNDINVPSYFSVTADSGSPGGSDGWNTPANAENAPDGAYATNNDATGGTTYLNFTAWQGSAIPSGATILGIKIAFFGHATGGTGSDGYDVGLIQGGVSLAGTSHDKTLVNLLPSSDSWSADLGGPTDLWSATLTPAIVNDPTFGVQLRCTFGAGGFVASIDSGRMTVFYAVAPVTVLRPLKKRYVDKIVERVRKIVKILPIATPQPSAIMLPVNRFRRQIETRTQKLRPLIIGTPAPPAPPAVVILVRRPWLYKTSFPQIRNRALVTSVQVNTIPFLKKPRLYEVRYPAKRVIGNLPWVSFVPIVARVPKAHPVYYPVKRQQKGQFSTQLNQPLLVAPGKLRSYPVPHYAKRTVRALFTSVTNVTTNVTTPIAPARRARPYSQPYVVQRAKGVPIQSAPVVVGSARRLRAYPVAAIYKTKPRAMVTSVVVQPVPLPMRRTRTYQVPYQPKRVSTAFFTSITVNPLVIAPARTRLEHVASVVKRKTAMAIYLQPLIVAPQKRVRIAPLVSVVKRLSPLPSVAGQSLIVPVRSNRLYQLASQPRRSVNRPLPTAQSLVVAPRKVRQANILYPQKRPTVFVSTASAGSAVIVSKRVRTVAVHSVRRIVKTLPGSGAGTSLVIAPRRNRLAPSLYPVVRRMGGVPSLNVSQAVQIARARNVRFVATYFPQKRSMASALFGQPVLVTSPRKVR